MVAATPVGEQVTDNSDTSDSAGASERADVGPDNAQDKVSDTAPDNAPEIGQKITYADTVPALLRGDLTLSPMRQRYAQRLDEMTHLERAARGRLAWNLWVKATHARWLVRESRGDTLHVALKPTDGNPLQDDYFEKNGIDFTKGLTAGEDGLFDMPVSDFTGFVFPFPVSFTKASFGEIALFSGASFGGNAGFEEANFGGIGWFRGASFGGDAWFNEAKFGGIAVFSAASFGGDAGFREASFGGDAGFEKASFGEDAWFSAAYFGGDAGFEKASFGGDAGFNEATFEAASTYQRAVFFRGARWYDSEFAKSATWGKAVFWQEADFENSRFRASVDLDHATFGQIAKGQPPAGYADWPLALRQAFDAAPLVGPNSETVPNFKGAEFVVPPDLGFTTVNVPPAPDFTPGGRGIAHRLFGPFLRFFGRYPESYQIDDSAAAAKLRRLQELADKGHHAYAEKRFFRAELLCRRGHEATAREIAMINAFELFSGCGLSFWRPISWWVGVFAVFALVYGGFAGMFTGNYGVADYVHLINYTFSNATPVLGVIKASDSAAVQALFIGGQPPWVTLLAGVHNLVSTVFLFFALLAIRNYFKLG